MARTDEELIAWHAQGTPEPVLEPELEIIDPHHHLWDHRSDPGWPFGQKLYGLEEFLTDIRASGHNVIGTVYVQAGTFHRRDGPAHLRPVGEVEYCQGIAAAADSGVYKNSHGRVPRICLGIQGTVGLKDPKVGEALSEMMSRSRNFRGVRCGDKPYDDDFKRGFRLLDQHCLVFDRWHHPSPAEPEGMVEEIPKLAALAREFPGVTVVLNHLGGAVGPKMSSPGAFERWQAAIADIAACENVFCKVGGIQMTMNGWGFESRETPIGSAELCELTFPWYEHVIRSFTPRRCMFESNFPVDKECVSYRTLWNTFKRIATRLGLSDAEKQDIFKDTAVRVYKLREDGDYTQAPL